MRRYVLFAKRSKNFYSYHKDHICPLGSLRQAISYPVVEEVISENIVMKK